MKIRAFITHKINEKYSDCQDRFSINVATKSVAVSDGMSQSYQQKIWASLLVKHFVENTNCNLDHSSLENIKRIWLEHVENYIKELKEPYLVKMNERALKERKSAGATFLGIRFKGLEWSGIVLGDTALIEVSENNEVRNIYSSQDGSFDNYPDYFDSGLTEEGKGEPKNISGILKPGYKLLLVSDPFSNVFQKSSNGASVKCMIAELLAIKSHNDFCRLVDDWRKSYGMPNDDTTIVMIESDDNDEFIISHEDKIEQLIGMGESAHQDGGQGNIVEQLFGDSQNESISTSGIIQVEDIVEEILNLLFKNHKFFRKKRVLIKRYKTIKKILLQVLSKYSITPK